MSKNKIKVSKIVLKLDGKEVELTIKQAMELKKILNDTFPEKETKYIPYPTVPYAVPYYVESYPVIIRKYNWEIWSENDIGTAVENTSGTLYLSNNSME